MKKCCCSVRFGLRFLRAFHSFEIHEAGPLPAVFPNHKLCVWSTCVYRSSQALGLWGWVFLCLMCACWGSLAVEREQLGRSLGTPGTRSVRTIQALYEVSGHACLESWPLESFAFLTRFVLFWCLFRYLP